MRLFCLIVLSFLYIYAFADLPRSDPFQPSTEVPREEYFLQDLYLPIHYAEINALTKLISDKSANLLSSHGHILADPQTNQLYIQDLPQNLAHIRSFIKHFDVSSPQILIKAQIASIDLSFMHTLGTLFSTGNTPNNTASENTVRLPLIKFMDGSMLDMQITALENAGHAKLISSPELVTLNHMPATIESGEEIPYQQTTYSGGTSVVFKKAVLRLKVTPRILTNKVMLLTLSINQDKVSALVVHGEPAISTQLLQTQVLIKSGQTLVLGGIYEQENSNQQDGIPGLRKLPAVGVLFSQNKQIHNRRQLLVFITPKIIN